MEVLKLEVYNSRWTPLIGKVKPLHSTLDQIEAHSRPSLGYFFFQKRRRRLFENSNIIRSAIRRHLR